MAHSLANAIHEVRDWQAAIVFLGDMPFVQAETVDSILGEYQFRRSSAPIVVPIMNGHQGHPVLFSHEYFKEIQQLTGDHGAKCVIDSHPGNVYPLEVLDPGVIKDIDTQQDLQEKLAG